MLNIDGLASGLDTSTIIEGLLSIQQQQVDRFNSRKEEVEEERTAFQEIETRILSLQSTVSELSAPRNNAFLRKTITPNDETAVRATVSNEAVNGIHSLTINRLARNHQIASNDFESPDAPLADGTITISAGVGGTQHEIDIAGAGGTIEGIAETINRNVTGIGASIIQTSSSGFKLLLSADRTGAANGITITSTASNPAEQSQVPAFDLDNPVQAAEDAEIQLGSGPGALLVHHDTNQIDELFSGVTIDLLKAQEGVELQLTVESDATSARDAVQDFVDAYNSVIEYTNEQTAFSAEDGTAATLFGNRSLRTIRDELSSMIIQAVPDVPESANGDRFNRLTQLGIRLEGDGTLTLQQDQLDRILAGQVEGVGQEQITRLLGFAADSDHASIQFLSASSDTQPSGANPYNVEISQAATQATLRSTVPLGILTTIDDTNNELSLAIDGFAVDENSPLTLTNGDYTREELAAHVEEVIANAQELASREVRVAVVDGSLQIRSLSYGSGSQIDQLGGSVLAALGLSETQSAEGNDVVGRFTYLDGEETVVETASGTGRILRGDRQNDRTSGLSLRVTLTEADVTEAQGKVTSQLGVTLGLAARLDNLIEGLTDRTEHQEGEFATAFRELDGRISSIDKSLDRLNAQFERQEQSLLQQFTSLETRLSELQGLGNILSAQLASLPTINRR